MEIRILNILGKTILVTFLSCSSAVSLAASTALVNLLEPLVNGAGGFEQVTYDSNGQAVQRSSGKFALMSPGKFYWHTTDPYEQILVSDAQTIWLYDPDLEQVTVKSFADEQSQLPVRILSGEFDLLDKEFELSENSNEDGRVFLLEPKSGTGNVASINLKFVGRVLASMTVVDKTNTKTEFSFSDRTALSEEDKSSFAFEIPEGADVFHDQPL